MNPGIPQQPSWEPTTDLRPSAQLDPSCQIKFQFRLEFCETLIGILLPGVSLGSPVPDAVVSWGCWGTMVALGASSPEVLCPMAGHWYSVLFLWRSACHTSCEKRH